MPEDIQCWVRDCLYIYCMKQLESQLANDLSIVDDTEFKQIIFLFHLLTIIN